MSANSNAETIRVVKNENYSPINHTGPRDKRLSWGARGILVYLLTKPDNWNPTVEDLVNHAPEGKAAVRRMMDELRRFGYLKRERIRADKGRFIWQTTLYEMSQGEDFSTPKKAPPLTENRQVADAPPSTDFPSMAEPSMDKPEYGATVYGESVDIRSNEGRSIEEEVLNEEVAEEVERAQQIETNSAAAAIWNREEKKEIAAALCKVCELTPTALAQRDKAMFPNLFVFLRSEMQDKNGAAAAAEVERRYAPGVWPFPTPPHLSQIPTQWVKQGRAADCAKPGLSDFQAQREAYKAERDAKRRAGG